MENLDPYEYMKISGLRVGLVRIIAQNCEKQILSANLQATLFEEDEKEVSKVVRWVPNKNLRDSKSISIAISAQSQRNINQSTSNRIKWVDSEGYESIFMF
jgi:hypothetical protein